MKNIILPAANRLQSEAKNTQSATFSAPLRRLDRRLKGKSFDGVRFFILVDENSYNHCLPLLVSTVERLQEAELLEVPVGEECKDLAVARQLWESLLESGADRDTVLVNLGGGCVSDLGGFVAAGFKRGIRYINVPTTLVGMIDASIGGKTAVNLDMPDLGGRSKNQVGFFYPPLLTCIEPTFLDTLPQVELKSGLCEMLKTLLIGAPEQYERLCDMLLSGDVNLDDSLISTCVNIKSAIVKADPYDRGIRKMLNLGHTAGHAIEAYPLHPTSSYTLHATPYTLSHGLAVGVGLWCALYLSVHKLGLDPAFLQRYTQVLQTLTPLPHYTLKDTEELLTLMRHDKKNSSGILRCVLLQQPGAPVIDVPIDENEMRQALLKIGC